MTLNITINEVVLPTMQYYNTIIDLITTIMIIFYNIMLFNIVL